jgi:DAACS family dicarboxylate/amino acid:cation (Na+ or H+) symporter
MVTTSVTGPIGQIFLGLLFMLVLPLLFSAIVVGVAEMGDLGSLGRVGWKTLLMTVVISSIAVLIGLGMVNWLRPGDGVDQALAQQLLTQYAESARGIVENAPERVDLSKFFLDLVPRNVFAAAAENQILPFMVFAVFFGVGLVMVRSKATDQLQLAIVGLFEVMMRLLTLVIKLAPLAIACLMFNLAALFGWDLLVRLAAFVGVAVGAMAIHMFIVYPLVVMIFGGKNPLAFFQQVRDPMLVAFSTASSNATLPISLRAAETELKLPRKISRFVLTVGATANQNGTALFEGVTVLFLAQFFGIDLSLQQQVVVMLVCILGGIGTAGVPAGSLPVIAMILVMVGIPPEGIGLILGVDRFLDMCRTTLNVTGDLVVATVVSRGETDPVTTPAAQPEAPPA